MPPRKILPPISLTPDHKKVMRIMAHMERDLSTLHKKYENLANRLQPELASMIIRSRASDIKQVSIGLKTHIEMMNRQGWKGQL